MGESPLDRNMWHYLTGGVVQSILTGWQCLMMTSGLLKRWRVYYSPLPTLIRLLALQGKSSLVRSSLLVPNLVRF